MCHRESLMQYSLNIAIGFDPSSGTHFIEKKKCTVVSIRFYNTAETLPCYEAMLLLIANELPIKTASPTLPKTIFRKHSYNGVFLSF